MLLTRAPRYNIPEGILPVRLACVRHAASVRSEPESNSPVEFFFTTLTLVSRSQSSYCPLFSFQRAGT